ncbi:MAG: outer membrane porin, OprD family [Bacteroidetes bacterium]|nr:outer membrane porin, OprD family [Bacteroidota bacterium]
MGTINEGALKDDYAIAAGLGAGITTKSFHGFQLGVSSFVTYNLTSSNLSQNDSFTAAPNRYEIGMFDLTNPTDKVNLIRIENLFLKYNFSKSSITVGKMKLNTPFINPQDGRMNTTLEEGIWLSWNESKLIAFQGGWLWNISPRSTTRWYSVEQSIGLYPSGVNEKGQKSNYVGNLKSNGIIMANISAQPNKHIKLNVWNMMVTNIINSAMGEVNTSFGDSFNFYQGLMFIHQNAINDGGNADPSKSYLTKGAQSNILSAQVGVKYKWLNSSVNYTHITGDGRYLSPREWGKDPFYTFMPRERNDGLGKVHAVVIKTTLACHHEKIKTGVAYGYFSLPDVKDFRLNKYGMPSYHQFNLDFSYNFIAFFKGMELKFNAAMKKMMEKLMIILSIFTTKSIWSI